VAKDRREILREEKVKKVIKVKQTKVEKKKKKKKKLREVVVKIGFKVRGGKERSGDKSIIG